MAEQAIPAHAPRATEAPSRSRDGLSKFAWDLLAEQMLLTQLAGSIAQVRTGEPIVRVCRHCGTLASEAALQNEPLCSRAYLGRADSHSYVDFDARQLAPAPVADEWEDCPECDGHGQLVERVCSPQMFQNPYDAFDAVACIDCGGSGRVAAEAHA